MEAVRVSSTVVCDTSCRWGFAVLHTQKSNSIGCKYQLETETITNIALYSCHLWFKINIFLVTYQFLFSVTLVVLKSTEDHWGMMQTRQEEILSCGIALIGMWIKTIQQQWRAPQISVNISERKMKNKYTFILRLIDIKAQILCF